jgi:primosomal protein N''
MSYDRMGPKIEDLKAQVAAMLAEAEATDRAEDEEFGEDRRGDELPTELATKEGRLARMRAAKAAIEAEAREKAAAKAATKVADSGGDEAVVSEAAEMAAATATPNPKTQRNFTDPESRMMKTTDGFHYAYNAQTVADEGSQVVLAAEVTQQAADIDQFFFMVGVTEGNLDAADIDDSPEVILADAGYCSEANLKQIADAEINALVATGRIRGKERVPDTPRGRIPKNATQRQRMARRLRTKAGRADYARRKAIVEPAFSQMKVRQAAGHLRLRGLAGAQGEWTLHVICHNLRKLANANGVALRAC